MNCCYLYRLRFCIVYRWDVQYLVFRTLQWFRAVDGRCCWLSLTASGNMNQSPLHSAFFLSFFSSWTAWLYLHLLVRSSVKQIHFSYHLYMLWQQQYKQSFLHQPLFSISLKVSKTKINLSHDQKKKNTQKVQHFLSQKRSCIMWFSARCLEA